MKKKMMALALAGAMLAMTACGSSGKPADTAATKAEAAAAATEAPSSAATQAADNSGKTYKVGICQLVQHDALDAATKGFEDALKDKFGDNVTIDYQNAQGDSATCATIVNGFVSNQYDPDPRERDAGTAGSGCRDNRYPDSRNIHYRLRHSAESERFLRHNRHERFRHVRPRAA